MVSPENLFTTDVEDLTRKTGNFKQFPIFCSMLESAVRKVSCLKKLSKNDPSARWVIRTICAESDFARGCGSRSSIRLFEFSESTSANNTVISNSISFTVVGPKGESPRGF